MCGIAGLWELGGQTPHSVLQRTVMTMAERLRHRGPDDGDVWVDAEAGIALGHRRLSIIDLSSAGRQPMVSANGRYVTVYNGEIYNYRELRAELAHHGYSFRSESDTEVLLAACSIWGVRKAIDRLNGMFAIAMWDRSERVLHFVRDRLGEKPLYWGRFGRTIVFGSELKALRAYQRWQPELNRDALAAFLRHNYVPAPHTIYRGVEKLKPGRLLTIASSGETREEAYWDAYQASLAGQANQSPANEEESASELEALLLDAVKRRMISDVPLGAFLSGGYDSSTIVSLMQKCSARPVQTYTIGFEEAAFNEAEHAKAVAKHLGTEHTELYVTGAEARAIVPRLAEMYDEPFADSSQIPTHLMCALTRRSVKVALSGDGGDELFAGYDRYRWADTIWRRLRKIPRAIRVSAAGMIRAIPQHGWDRISRSLPRRIRYPQMGHKGYKLAELLVLEAPGPMYRGLITHWENPDRIVLDASEPRGILSDTSVEASITDFVRRMQFLDTVTYLPDDILVKVDRASMAVALEVRVPFLDHRVVEFACRLPLNLNGRAPEPKYLIRRIAERALPRALLDRPKMGFGAPIGSWLRGPMREWAEDLLAEDRLLRDGIFDPTPIRARWQQHLANVDGNQYLLWDILMFQTWLDRWLRSENTAAYPAQPDQTIQVAS